MPKKGKEEYSTLEQIINALSKKQKLDENKHAKLQNAIRNINASNVNDIVRNYLSKCLEIKLEIDGLLLVQLNPIATVDKVNKLNQEVESINKRIDLIDINSINLKYKKETEEVKTQINALKDNFKSNIEKFEKKLKEKENELKEEKAQERELQEQQGVSSSSDQSPVKETGAVPKKKSEHKEKRREQSLQEREEQRKQHQEERKKEKELRAKYEAEKLQKEREKYYPDFKEKLTDYLKITNCQIIFSLFRDIKEVYNKKNNVPETIHISEKNYKKFNKVLAEHIKAYNFVIILNQLLKKDCITIDLQKYKNSDFNISKSARMCGDKITVLFQKIKDTISKSGITTSDYLDYIPNIENIKDIENNLVEELPDLYQNLLTEQKQGKHAVLQVNGQPSSKYSDEIGNDHLFDQIVFNDCIKGRKNTNELLRKIMEEHGYQEKVDEIVKKLSKQYQQKYPPSPSHEVEEASLQGGACAQTER